MRKKEFCFTAHNIENLGVVDNESIVKSCNLGQLKLRPTMCGGNCYQKAMLFAFERFPAS